MQDESDICVNHHLNQWPHVLLYLFELFRRESEHFLLQASEKSNSYVLIAFCPLLIGTNTLGAVDWFLWSFYSERKSYVRKCF